MKTKILLSFIYVLLSSLMFASVAGNISIVPLPMQVTGGKGTFFINNKTKILIDDSNNELRPIAKLLVSKINLASGFSLEIGNYSHGEKVKNAIVFTSKGADAALGKEGYLLEVTKKAVFIRSVAANGIFYGLQSLFQLLPPEIEKSNSGLTSLSIPAVIIKDMPRYGYRGLHLDVGRHMYPVEFIKKYIDLMAMYKMNTFHWHLTEDQGWRIEIKKYPELTRKGSIRKGTQIGRTSESDSIPYGGFYTQDQARDIVNYASARFITVIPEIEMPGHSVAALSVYPRLSCTGGPFEVRTNWGVSDDIYCAGNDSVFLFLQDVLTEIMDIFPSEYIHIGGDEAPKARWKACTKCQARIKTEGLKDEAVLQSYFIKRIEKFLISKNRRLIGWDEILEGGLAPEATVMAWRGVQAGIDAATQGHDAIMTPVDYCYLDYYQGDAENEPESIGGKTTLKTVYSYNPTPPVLTPEQQKHILGVQGCVWTEYTKTSEMVEYKTFPRALAVAEVAWSQQARRDWDDFINRMDNQFSRLRIMGVKYSKGSFVADIATVRDKDNNRNLVVITSETKGLEIRYTLDGSEPSINSPAYSQPFALSKTTLVKAALFNKGSIAGSVNQREILVNKASGKPVNINKPYSFKYPGTGDQAMTDGQAGTSSYKSGWQGYEGCDMEFVVDMQHAVKISSIRLGFVQNPGDWVLFPKEVLFYISTDGENWKPTDLTGFNSAESKERKLASAEAGFPETEVRFIKVSAISPKVLPQWHEYKGQPCWIFADELVVE